jgi:multidrug resistance efflux pump
VASPVPGKVAEVLVKAGHEVPAGTAIFRMDDWQLRAEWQTCAAALAVTQAHLARLKSLPRPQEVPISAARVPEAAATNWWPP